MNTIARIFLKIAEIFADNLQIPVSVIIRCVQDADMNKDGNLSVKEIIEAVRGILEGMR